MRKAAAWVCILLLVFATNTGYVTALSKEQRRVIDGGIRYFDVEDIAQFCATLLAGNDNSEKVWNYLVTDMGFTANQAAGIMGNIQAESGFNPFALNPSTTSETPVSLDRAWGVIQWFGGRQTTLIEYAATNGLDITQPGVDNDTMLGIQLDFMKQELETGYKSSVLDPILASTTVEEAARIWLESFEVPCLPGSAECDEEMGVRLPFANNWLSQQGTSSGTSGGQSAGCVGSNIDGVSCPTVLEPHLSRAGYFRFPDAENGEYVTYMSETRRFGSQELVCVIYTVALAFNEAMGGRSQLRIGDLNAGEPHVTHAEGTSVDLSGAGELQVASHTKDWKGTYDKDATVLLGKMFADTGQLRNIFWCPPDGDDSLEQIRTYAQDNDLLEGTVSCVEGHADHFHVDIKAEYRLEFWKPA